MKKSTPSPNYTRWAVIAVIIPAALIFLLGFVIGPRLWSDSVTSQLRSALGEIFLVWLLCLTIAAVWWKIRTEKKSKKHNV